MLNKINNFWFGQVSPVRLQAFRVCISLSIIIYMIERFKYAKEWLTPQGFHVSAQLLPYHPVTVPLLSESLLIPFAIVLFTSLICVLLGRWLAITTWVAFLCIVYVTLADQLAAFTLNKLSIISLLLLATTSKEHFNEKISAWPIRTLQATFLIHYFMAGWSKVVFGDWFVTPYALFTHVQGVYRTEFASFLLAYAPLKAWVLMSACAISFELIGPFFIALKPLRRAGLIWAAGLQIMIALTMHQLIYFMLVMFSFFMVFLSEAFLKKHLKSTYK